MLSAPPKEPGAPVSRERLRLRGVVQGVGMRPFVFGLAERFGLAGSVRNDAEGVLIEAEGSAIEAFVAALRENAPPLARIDAVERTVLVPTGERGFAIVASVGGRAATLVPADAATCTACLDELFDPASRFHLYPFVNCTHCGPRYTITRRVPYDRPNTAMAGFAMCPACAAAYENPRDRRFHAEPVACPVCGPQLSHSAGEIAAAIRAGRIVALKGIGGFHLMCDATDEAVVAELRRRKRRDAKPFAVMVANAASLALFAAPGAAHLALAETPARPIVLMPLRGDGERLAPSVAPSLAQVGLVLPYAPVHHLLFHALLGCPDGRAWREAPHPVALVATSANPGGEPLVVDDADARRRLAGIADLIVGHGRPIVVRADDSVMTVIDGAPAFVRRARGVVPDPVDLGRDGPCVLALGAHLKATVCVTRGREAFVSQHVGDLDTAETVTFYRETIAHLTAILDVTPEGVACDLHPDYRSTRLAEELGPPVVRVQHHAAHVAAVAAEHGVPGPVLGVALDGHGIGETDGQPGGNWGGELIEVDGAGWRRLGHLAPLALPGGDRAAREPWRMAVAALAAIGRAGEAACRFPAVTIAGALAARIDGAPVTTSLGRLFDAAAGLLGVRTHQAHEGQAAMELEALCGAPRTLAHGFVLADGVLDFAPLLAALADCDDARAGAALFHGTLIAGLGAWIGEAAQARDHRTVALGGGCLMNRVLAEGLAADLRGRGLVPLLARKLPPNDGGLSLGQAVMARAAMASASAAAGGSQ
ncbi:carbamoyltransferase HypF [Rhodoplanes sp. TEM]|uniref:Carbamoyltransferase HypF n=1 Tax=Rhodoplanes tepidamans TaxID=200616 RepID=A0ABT5JC96_RHOTP|nr:MULTISPECIES: carbamoyltransferase HypF [Rhodoplanes]MDC7786996.1 carbamoyltransferase HypF [Rhodoplanes tepidamans]MDC7987004.1 carbamoyltransferase HypF [Rhodoplanes sp. TEM]MDQ0354279.1 hydrogenase maturation protein HypF [Rhodoplanes tepidamans]